MKTLKIYQHKKFLPICVCCGNSTQSIFIKKKWEVNFKKSRQRKAWGYLEKLIALCSSGIFFVRARDHNKSVTVKFPMCENCKKSHHYLEPVKIDFNRKYMVFEIKELND